MRRRSVLLPLAVLGLLLYLAFLFCWLQASPASFQDRAATVFRNPLAATQNATLGFEKVFAVGFSNRTDKRDALTMAASFVGIDISWFEGVTLGSMPQKAYPATWDPVRERPSELACWRAHMNVLQHIVAKRISSALILEDDADWDITLKAQIIEFARGVRAIQQKKWPRGGGTKNPPVTPSGTPSPYGDDWDLLWIGTCGTEIREDERRYYIIPDDPTVPPVSRRTDFFHPDLANQDQMKQARMVVDSVSGSCTIGYAVTYDSARKIISRMSMSPLNSPIDMKLAQMCGSEGSEESFRCIQPYPALIASWRRTGPSTGDSDIYEHRDDWHEAYSHGIVFSTMLNAQRLAHGSKTCLAQWTESLQHEIDPAKFVSPRGFLYEGGIPDLVGKMSHSEIHLA